MLTTGAALRFAENAGVWLRKREPSAWLALAMFVLKDDGSHRVLRRTEVIVLLEKARAKALGASRAELAAELARGIDLVKGAAPVEVPVVVFLEKEDGNIDTGVITVQLPAEVLKQKGPAKVR